MPADAKWKMLADDIRNKIKSGELAAGDKLPSTAQLCRQHSVSEIVIRNAIFALKAEGLVYSVHGVGVFVADR